MAAVLIGRGNDAEIQGKEVEVGGTQPHAREHQEPLEAGGGEEGFFPSDALAPYFLLPELREKKVLLF